jgi:hypothetical protein
MAAIMRLPQILNVISAANWLTPEQTQILEKGLRKLGAGRSRDLFMGAGQKENV